MHKSSRFLALLLAVSLLLANSSALHAQAVEKQGLREVVAELAAKTRDVAKKLGQQSVRIGHFTPSGIDDGNAGAALMAELALVFQDFAKPDAILELRGEYSFVANPDVAGTKIIKVEATLKNLQSSAVEKEFTPFQGFIRANEDLGRLLGPTAAVPPEGSYTERNKEIQKGLPPAPGKPPVATAHLHGLGNTLVSTKADCKYAVEIRTKPLLNHDKQTAVAREIKLVDGLPFVGIDKDNLYEVRVLNNTESEIAVALCCDGIDQFTFSEDRKEDGRPRFTHWIVGPKVGDKPGEVLILGWHKTAVRERKDNVLSFLVTEYGNGASSKLKFPAQAQGKVGMIEVAIADTFPPGTKGGSETGFGPPREVKQEVVKRDIGKPHDFITIRYAR